MDERDRLALDQLIKLQSEMRTRYQMHFALVSDSELRALIEYCQALLALRESRPRD